MPELVFGDCKTARGVESGIIASRTSAADWHRMCPGALVGARGESRCACECHVGETIRPRHTHHYCVRCSDDHTDREKIYGPGGLECVDRAQCDADRERKVQTSPAFRRMVERREARRKQSDDLIAAESALGQLRSGRAKTGRCQYSGQPTRGGRFLPGNDAKLKTVLNRLARQGRTGAIAEILYREWPHDEASYPSKAYADAQTHLREHDADDWFDRRMERRWKLIEEGDSPETAIRRQG